MKIQVTLLLMVIFAISFVSNAFETKKLDFDKFEMIPNSELLILAQNNRDCVSQANSTWYMLPNKKHSKHIVFCFDGKNQLGNFHLIDIASNTLIGPISEDEAFKAM